MIVSEGGHEATQSADDRRIRIRPCRAADLSAVLQLWKRAGAAPSVTDSVAALRRRLLPYRGLFLLAWNGDTLVGSIMGGWDGWRASVARLAIDPRYRRLGLARVLVEHVEKRLRAFGATRMSCVVLADDAGGRAFWTAARYQHDPAAVRYVKDLR
jgi:ribosomal protein S18 acetylase RimI-like enzyme